MKSSQVDALVDINGYCQNMLMDIEKKINNNNFSRTFKINDNFKIKIECWPYAIKRNRNLVFSVKLKQKNIDRQLRYNPRDIENYQINKLLAEAQ
jgi:hypothetical protein